ncbi:MAG: macro domain-containing protein [Endomicrobium sp.]|nr:macro domain-containing protein [Endomicrobium sp.]
MNHKDTPRIEKSVNGTKIVLIKGDITKLKFNPSSPGAIVNAANEGLVQGGGVCGDIYTAAGPGLNTYTSKLGNFSGSTVKCPTGKAVITPSFNLENPPHYITRIIHAVGPVGEKTVLLRSAYTESLEVAQTNSVHRIAFPCISTSIFGYPPAKAAPVAFQAVIDYVNAHHGHFTEIIFVCFSESDYFLYEPLIAALP